MTASVPGKKFSFNFLKYFADKESDPIITSSVKIEIVDFISEERDKERKKQRKKEKKE